MGGQSQPLCAATATRTHKMILERLAAATLRRAELFCACVDGSAGSTSRLRGEMTVIDQQVGELWAQATALRGA
ncbi:MAG: hypothetical protein JKY37_18705 [Nannocystaceae bacterium]|nr:hypothetical protein [Nannocystaceae bacterium]